MHKQWENFSNEIEEYIKRHGIENFYSCPTINRTMFLSDDQFVEDKILLCKHVFGDIERLLKCDNIPSRNIGGYDTNVNTLHQLYHLAVFVKNGGKLDVNCIFEFGAGYGELCRLIYELGFDGEYFIYDIPVLINLQKYYLNEYPVRWNELVHNPDLFISMWALSEVEDKEREVYKLVNSSQYMFAYGNSFFDVMNNSYFDSFKENTEVEWKSIKHPHLNNQQYLFGV